MNCCSQGPGATRTPRFLDCSKYSRQAMNLFAAKLDSHPSHRFLFSGIIITTHSLTGSLKATTAGSSPVVFLKPMKPARRHLVRLTQVPAAMGRSQESENTYKALRYASWSEQGTQNLTGPCMIVSFTTRHSGTEEVHSSSFILTAMPSSLREVPEAQSIVYIKLCPRSHSNFFSFRVPGLRKTKSPSRLSTPSSTSLLQYIEAQKPPRQLLQTLNSNNMSTPPTTITMTPLTPRRTTMLPNELLRKIFAHVLLSATGRVIDLTFFQFLIKIGMLSKLLRVSHHFGALATSVFYEINAFHFFTVKYTQGGELTAFGVPKAPLLPPSWALASLRRVQLKLDLVDSWLGAPISSSEAPSNRAPKCMVHLF